MGKKKLGITNKAVQMTEFHVTEDTEGLAPGRPNGRRVGTQLPCSRPHPVPRPARLHPSQCQLPRLDAGPPPSRSHNETHVGPIHMPCLRTRIAEATTILGHPHGDPWRATAAVVAGRCPLATGAVQHQIYF